MCDFCFKMESVSFKSAEEYKNFDLILTNKILFNKSMQPVKFVKTGEVQIDFRDCEDVGYNVYKCLNCQSLWAFRPEFEPNQISFFPVTKSRIQQDTYRPKNNFERNLIILIIAVVAVTLIIAWVNN